jgi:uncharacterized protein (DUF4415 family)/uncharacterized DUF497 family protein
MRFEWDENKNRRNLAKHKISFETASLVFDDPQALSVQDRVVEGEERWQTLGMMSGIAIIVAHTIRRKMAGKKWSGLFRHERRPRMKGVHMRKINSTQAREIRALKRMRERDIDTTDIPATLDWSKAVVGKFYRPIKKPLTIRVDADVLAWLKAQGKGYQTRINAILRTAMERASSIRS